MGMYSIEDIIFIFICMLTEVNVVFISESLRSISLSMYAHGYIDLSSLLSSNPSDGPFL